MKKYVHPPKSSWQQLCTRPVPNYFELEKQVRPILDGVKKDGDAALRKFVQKFDKVQVKELEVTPEEFEKAKEFVSPELKKAIQVAKYNIAKFHLSQKQQIQKMQTMEGVTCWRKSTAISKVGLYIPSRSAPLFSAILMLGVPANIAGCEEIVLCSTPNYEGNIHPIILYTAGLINIRKVFKVGGAQAIAGMAYGTETVPKVYKIFGPSNEYVTAAKQLVSEEGIAVDFTAGTSELLVIADDTANPVFIAADLLAQAEHGSDNHVVLVTTSEQLVAQVQIELQKQLEQLPRKDYASKALNNDNSMAIVLKNSLEAIEFANEYAPEHIVLAVYNPDVLADRIINAGSVFLGHYSSETIGDYASGTNHTLPTRGFAKAFSPVSLDSFVKKITFQKISSKGIKNIGNVVETMAEAEGLLGHKNSISVRLKSLES